MSFDLIVSADWSKHPAKRAVWVAAPATKEVRRLEPTPGNPWTVTRVLERTSRFVGTAGSALVSFDAPIGVPESYLAAARTEFGAAAAATFLDWLPLAAASCEFWDPVLSPADWSVRRPFFVVPKGKGSLDGFYGVAATAGIELRRDVEFSSQGKSVFAFGLPGQVAPAAQALWQELLKARSDFTSMVVWPFEGSLDVCEQGGFVVAENYPRAAYGTALSGELPAKPRALSKSKQPTRAAEVINLQASPWLADAGVSLHDLPAAVASEDDFDALMTVTALLRLTLAGIPEGASPNLDRGLHGRLRVRRKQGDARAQKLGFHFNHKTPADADPVAIGAVSRAGHGGVSGASPSGGGFSTSRELRRSGTLAMRKGVDCQCESVD